MNRTTPEHMQQQDTVYALAASVATLYAGRASGLYRSQDGGVTWQATAISLHTDQPFSVTAVIAQGNSVFAGLYGSVLFSHDDGATWQVVPLASPPPQVVALALSPIFDQDGTVAAGTAEDGVFISTDRGLHWTAWNFGLIDHAVYVVAISPDFAADSTIFAGTESGLFRSHNGGRGWHELPFPADAAPVLSLAASPGFAADGLVYAGTEHKGLFVSHDRGKNWQPVNIGGLSAAIHAVHLTPDPTPGIWLLLEDGLIYSPDGGRSWQHDKPTLSDKLAMTMLPLPGSPNQILIGFADGDILPLS